MNNDKPWERVTNCSYYKHVWDNMRVGPLKGTVRFGIQGDGIRPNYQVEFSNGDVVAYRGDNHQEYEEVEDRFKEEHLSEPYTDLQVHELRTSCEASRRWKRGNR